MTDNTTTVAYISNMGGSHSLDCIEIAQAIWLFCQPRDIWLTVSHIPGKHNVVADKASRTFDDSKEWKLDVDVFHKIISRWGKPDIDIFASRLNCQFSPHVSWHPDPKAWQIDAFTVAWNNHFIYAFPPFSVIP